MEPDPSLEDRMATSVQCQVPILVLGAGVGPNPGLRVLGALFGQTILGSGKLRPDLGAQGLIQFVVWPQAINLSCSAKSLSATGLISSFTVCRMGLCAYLANPSPI